MADKSVAATKRHTRGVPIRHMSDVRPPDLFRGGIGRLFDDFFTGFSLRPFSGLMDDMETFSPKIDVTEDEKAIHVNAELPGLDEKDIDISLSSDSITISGEKKEETESKGENYYCSERSYGSFTRVLPIEHVDVDKVEAAFKKGVLNITLPKLAGVKRSRRKIAVKGHSAS
jgi:HSP20 family protein